jgi:RNA polymerase sigma factor (sigma-70 family)
MSGCTLQDPPQAGRHRHHVAARGRGAPAGEPRATHASTRSAGDLLVAAAAGEVAAWGALVDRFGGLLWSATARYRLGDADRADAVQTAWLRLLQHAGDLERPEHVAAWLVTTARRECLRIIRTRSRELLTDDEEVLEPRSWGEDPTEFVEVGAAPDRLLWAAVRALPERQRLVMEALLADPSPSYAEVGALLGMPLGAIGPTRQRALRRLRRSPQVAAVLSTRGKLPPPG